MYVIIGPGSGDLMKKKNVMVIVFTVIGVVFVCALSFFVSLDASKESSSSDATAEAIVSRAKSESDAVKDSEKKELITINVDQYLGYYNGNENKLIFIGRPTCSYCEIAQPIVQNIAYTYDITIYYLNVDEFEGEDESKFFASNESFEDGFGTPMLLIVSNGEIVNKVDGLTDKENYIAFFKQYGFIQE